MRYVKFFIIIVLLFMWGCSSVSVDSDYDPEVDFSKYKTYKWYTGKTADDDKLAANTLVKNRVITGIDRALEAKGYNKAEGDAFDFVVLIHAGSKERMQISSYGYGGYGYGGYRHGYGWGGAGGYSDVSYYDETTLFIDVLDEGRKHLAWRGTATGTVKKYDNQEDMQNAIDNVTAKILADFPPGK